MRRIYDEKLNGIMEALPVEVSLTEQATYRVIPKTTILGPTYEARVFAQDVWIFETNRNGIVFVCNKSSKYLYQLGDLQTGATKYVIHFERLYEIALAKKQHMNAQLIFMWVMSSRHPLCEPRLLSLIQSYSC